MAKPPPPALYVVTMEVEAESLPEVAEQVLGSMDPPPRSISIERMR